MDKKLIFGAASIWTSQRQPFCQWEGSTDRAKETLPMANFLSNLPCRSDLMAGYLPLLVKPRHDTHRAVIVTGLRLIRGDGLASGAG